MIRRVAAVLALAAVMMCCAPETPEAPESTAPEQAAAPESAEATGQTRIRVTVRDLQGNPLEGIQPIVTRKANAFDPPVAAGPPSDAAGTSAIAFTSDGKLYLRGWDPEQEYFPNNFYDVLPKAEAVADVALTMVPAAALEVLLVDEAGRPLAGEDAGIMMFHPQRGPWWPSQGRTREDGGVRFIPVPAGEFEIRLRTESGLEATLPHVALPPDELVHAGMAEVTPAGQEESLAPQSDAAPAG